MSQEHGSRELPAGDGEKAETLRGAFRYALGGQQPADADRLREAACEYVRELRERDVSPESAVVAVKDILRRAIMGHTPTQDSRRAAESLVERVVTWCIEEYYRPPGDEARAM